MAKEESLKVAVRVCPFNNRELQRKAKCVAQMKGETIALVNPDDAEDVKNFTYDYSYWSFDGCKERSDGYFESDPSHKNSAMYADQMKVYKDLGKGILDSVWQGYNATLFAYGQTGSGKSWSVIGYGPNKGIVPLMCEDIFTGINQKSGGGTQFEVQFSMLEIYNEVVRDLLQPKQSKGGLKIREHPMRGFYAEGLKTTLVTSYKQMDQKMQEGTVNRTIASTNMNATSSRAHTIVGIKLIQKSRNSANVETTKTAIIHLVDLAGSARVEATGATGKRLKEEAAINRSLTKLGACIHALAEQSQGKMGIHIPFRSSPLTKLLKNALYRYNTKIIMVAAISPADINYDETMSTFRFADQAKQIKLMTTVNEEPVEKLLQDLKEENERLKKSMASGKINPAGFADEDGDGINDKDMAKLRVKWEEEMKARMLENDKEILEMKKTYEEKLKAQKKDIGDRLKKEEDRMKKPHIYNLNKDTQLSGKVVHILKAGATTIGNRKGNPSDITMVGPGIQEQHAVITLTQKNDVNIKPATSDCRVLVNGTQLQGEATLSHNDRLLLGSTQLWVFQHPAKKPKPEKGKKMPEITYDYAQEEIAAKNGINMSGDTDLGALQEELLQVMPAVEEANSISEELDKRVKFEVVLVAPEVIGSQRKGKSQVHVKMKNLENGTEFVWPQEKFRDRLYLMKEMYEHYEDEDEWERPEDEDPFQESLDTEVHMGTVMVVLQPIAHKMDMEDSFTITSYKGAEVGVMKVAIIPCNAKGEEFTEEDNVFVDDPDDLIGQNLHFRFKILNCRGLPGRYKDVYCSYSMYLDKEVVSTKKLSNQSNPDFNHTKQFDFKPVTKQLVEYLRNGTVVVRVMGKQQLRGSAIPPNAANLSTKEMLRQDPTVFSKTANLMNGFNMDGRVVDPNKQSMIVELLMMKKTQARLQQKIDGVRKLVKEAENVSVTKVSTAAIKDVLNSSSSGQADTLIRKHLEDPNFRNDSGWRSGGGVKNSSTCVLL